MNLVSYQPWNLLNGVSRISRGDLGFGLNSQRARQTWAPDVDIREEADAYVLQADVPGARSEDIEVTLHEGVLTIKGERQTEKVSENAGFRHLERSHGSFIRRFTLPEMTDAEEVIANVADGVLTVRIPKSDKALPRRIPVN